MCGPEGLQPIQCDFEKFRLRDMEKAGDVCSDGGLPIRLMGVYGEECRFAFIGVKDHFLLW